MDKEIIIDGVNVAGCEHNYVVSNKLYCGADYECVHNDCENYPNCYYKQLQRLQQENAELKAENERLKEELEIRDNLSETFRKEALSWANVANGYQKDRTKYEKVLQEIKEIIEDCNNGKCFSCEYNMEDAENCIDYRHNKILDLITKAEEE